MPEGNWLFFDRSIHQTGNRYSLALAMTRGHEDHQLLDLTRDHLVQPVKDEK
jgi:hypothetical protein